MISLARSAPCFQPAYPAANGLSRPIASPDVENRRRIPVESPVKRCRCGRVVTERECQVRDDGAERFSNCQIVSVLAQTRQLRSFRESQQLTTDVRDSLGAGPSVLDGTEASELLDVEVGVHFLPERQADVGRRRERSVSSEGQKICMPGIARITARSSMAWWVGPFASERNPGTPPTSLTGRPAIPTSSRMNSNARRVRKVASAWTTGIRPRNARPAAMPIIVCSQMPTSMKRSPSLSGRSRMAARFSAVSTRTRGSASARS